MLTSLYSGLSGLNANALQLSLIGNNLANVNTPGYKSSTAAFQDLLSQTIAGGSADGSLNYLQVGLGTGVAATDQNFSQGSLQATGVNTNVAIQGQGFFVVEGPDGTNYTRAGDFHIDANGNLVTTVPVKLDLPQRTGWRTDGSRTQGQASAIATDWHGRWWYVVEGFAVEVDAS